MQYFDPIHEGEPFARTGARLARDVDAAVAGLRALGEERASTPRAPGKWSPKEILGHLIDSAANNHQRFVRAQAGGSLRLPGYEQEHWVAAQRYRERPWPELVELWYAYNRHLAHVIAAIPEDRREIRCTIGDNPPVSLTYVALDYVGHIQHHLRQIFAEPAGGSRMSRPAIPIEEFDSEMAATRRLLERVPTDEGPWKPHPKSFPLGHLAQLVSSIPGWITWTLRDTSIDVAKAGGYTFQPTEALLAAFDQKVREARTALESVVGADLDVSWSLKHGDDVLMTMPRRDVTRQHLSHLIHHRGQLTVYLRLLDVPLPPIYGPTADEKW